MPSAPRIVVIGGGVNGTGSAIAILQRFPHCRLTLYAELLTPNTTGDGSAGFWSPYLLPDTSPEKIIKWSKATFDLFVSWWKAGDHGVLLSHVETISKDTIEIPEWKHVPYGFNYLDQGELKKYGDEYTVGYKYSAFVAEPSLFLPYLYKKLSSMGGDIVTRKLNSLTEVGEEADIIINCTGLGARTLVPDLNVYPIRGQVTRVQAPWVKTTVMDESEDSFGYVIPTSNSIVLGGTHQEGDWRTTVDQTDSQNIWRNCLNLMPSLKNAEIIKEWVGLRPGRKGGVRLEREDIIVKYKTVPVVHNYGHGGSGVTMFWGCAQEVAEVVGNIFHSRHSSVNLSKL